MRLFVAINFNDKTRAQLLALRDELCACSKGGNFSRENNLHLTLAFLGECDEKKTAAARAALDLLNFEPFHIDIECVGRFKREGGDIWWAGVQKSKQLLDLQSELANLLSAAGFCLDGGKYTPHITLGREVITDALPFSVAPFGEKVSGIDLMKSERIKGNLSYTAIHRKTQKNINSIDNRKEKDKES